MVDIIIFNAQFYAHSGLVNLTLTRCSHIGQFTENAKLVHLSLNITNCCPCRFFPLFLFYRSDFKFSCLFVGACSAAVLNSS